MFDVPVIDVSSLQSWKEIMWQFHTSIMITHLAMREEGRGERSSNLQSLFMFHKSRKGFVWQVDDLRGYCYSTHSRGPRALSPLSPHWESEYSLTLEPSTDLKKYKVSTELPEGGGRGERESAGLSVIWGGARLLDCSVGVRYTSRHAATSVGKAFVVCCLDVISHLV